MSAQARPCLVYARVWGTSWVVVSIVYVAFDGLVVLLGAPPTPLATWALCALFPSTFATFAAAIEARKQSK